MKQLFTRWGKNLDPEYILQEYPREQLKRDSYFNLNGYWNCTFSSVENDTIPSEFDQKILVPFSPESALSGVNRQLQPEEYLWYQRTLPASLIDSITEDPKVKRLLLHFGAVDQSCQVYFNGEIVGEHMGGYLPFTVDLTDAVTKAGKATDDSDADTLTAAESAIDPALPLLTVRVRDVSDTSFHARGKQKLQAGGMYYTATSGIWQTVWAEVVPGNYIQDLNMIPDIDRMTLTLTVTSNSNEPQPVAIRVIDHKNEANTLLTSGMSDSAIVLPVPFADLWTPEEPNLYSLEIAMGEDRITSYFAMRSVGIEKDNAGLPRICLNHKPLFMTGVLDQGYWPEGLYTPPSDEAIIFDLEEMKNFGFNMVRKHAKLESDRWYYHCDRLGLLVWQDMVNGGDAYDDTYVTVLPNLWNWKNTKHKTYDTNKTGRASEEGRKEFKEEIAATVDYLKNHPSIVEWTLFNEGWGQFETKECLDILQAADSTRLIDAASGWYDQNLGDFRSIHNYFFPLRVYPEEERAFILSEIGGLPMLITDHSVCEKIYGYGKKYTYYSELSEGYKTLQQKWDALIPKGLCAVVYTQWTDIENEVNGVYTWDREIKKIQM